MPRFFLAVLLITFLVPHAQANTPNVITLKNGVSVIHIESQRIPAVVHMVWYRVGAKDDPHGKEGLAHFVEHLMFKGTEKREAKEFSRIVRRIGGRDNAFTSWDYTAYFQMVAAEHLDTIMELEADRLQSLRFTLEEFNKERNVILAERAQMVDSNPVAQLREGLQMALYPFHPYARPVLGWPETIKAITFDDAREFYTQHYKPENAFIVVAGAVTEEEVKTLAEKHYGSLRVNEKPENTLLPPKQYTFNHVLSQKGKTITTPTLLHTIHIPDSNVKTTRQRLSFDILAFALGGSPTSRAHGRIIDNKNLATYLMAQFNENQQTGAEFSFSVVGKPPHLEGSKITTLLQEELGIIAEKGLNVPELSQAKTVLVTDSLYNHDSIISMAMRYGRLYALNIPFEREAEIAATIDAITNDDIQLAARAVLKQISVTGILTPHTENEAQ